MIDAPSRAVRQPPHAAGLRCERPGCGGPLLWQRENKFEWLAECVKCGCLQSWEHIRAPHQPQPQPEGVCTPLLREREESMTLYIDTDPSLVAGILDTLRRMLAVDAEIDTARIKQRAEAERLHAALTAYGAADVPALPWRTGPNGGKVRPKQCADCRQYKAYNNGRYVAGRWTCRRCEKRAAVAS